MIRSAFQYRFQRKWILDNYLINNKSVVYLSNVPFSLLPRKWYHNSLNIEDLTSMGNSVITVSALVFPSTLEVGKT